MYYVHTCGIKERYSPFHAQTVQSLSFPKRDRIEYVRYDVEELNRLLVLLVPQSYLHVVAVELVHSIPSSKHYYYRRIAKIKQISLYFALVRKSFVHLIGNGIDRTLNIKIPPTSVANIY